MAAFLQENAVFTDTVKLVENGEPIDGGSDGPINIQAKHLADRTQYLKQKIDSILATLTLLDNTVNIVDNTVTTIVNTVNILEDKVDTLEDIVADLDQGSSGDDGTAATIDLAREYFVAQF